MKVDPKKTALRLGLTASHAGLAKLIFDQVVVIGDEKGTGTNQRRGNAEEYQKLKRNVRTGPKNKQDISFIDSKYHYANLPRMGEVMSVIENSKLDYKNKQAALKSVNRFVEQAIRNAAATADGNSPDSSYQNKAFPGAEMVFRVEKNDFKNDLKRERLNVLPEDQRNEQDFNISTQLPALARLSQSYIKEGKSFNLDLVDKLLGKQGLSRTEPSKIEKYFFKSIAIGQENQKELFQEFVDKIDKQQRGTILG